MNRCYNNGGGTQSTATLILQARGVLPKALNLFANVGEDSEDPETLRYVREVQMPYAERHGIEVVEVAAPESLLSRLERTDGDLIPWMIGPRGRGKRACTTEWKRRVIGKELRRRGASPDNPWEVCLGITTDEYLRANESNAEPYERIVYPLLELGLSRDACMALIADEGLPMPPKSACWFCPFRSPLAWSEMRRDRPELFERACRLEEAKSARAVERGRRPLTLLRSYTPLRDLTAAGDELPFGADGCDDNTGCWT